MPNFAIASRPVLGAGLLFCTATYALLLGPTDRLLQLAGREQLVELLGALFLLGASLGCLGSFLRASRDPATSGLRRRAPLLVLALLFFAAFGEEVSWGQHLFGFETPDTFERHNIQRELNLHNLRFLDTFTTEGEKKRGLGLLLNSNRLFDYFMAAIFLLAPLAAARSASARARLEALGVPLLPPAFAALLVLNLAATAVAELFLVGGRYDVHLAVSEIRESNYALLCCLASLYWLSGSSPRPRTSTPPSSGRAPDHAAG